MILLLLFVKKRNTEEEKLLPKRGSIKDDNGNVLAEDVVSYNVVAYLDSSRSENSKKPLHVVDVNATAEKLAPYIKMDDCCFLKHFLVKKFIQLLMSRK